MGCVMCRHANGLVKKDNSPYICVKNASKSVKDDKKLQESNISISLNVSRLTAGSNIKISTSSMIKRLKYKVEDYYKVLCRLGKGTFGSVYKVLSIKEEKIRAMKVIKKENINLQDDDRHFLKEIEILMKTDHPNIIKIFEYFLDDVNYYLITEYISGGALYDTITSWRTFNEFHAANILYQLLSAINYLHSNGIVHRDIKPENILVEKINKAKPSEDDSIIIKLIDFGTSNYVSDSKLSLKVGTPYYMAPEILEGKYDEKVDIWSCGVLLYFLLIGSPPFNGRHTKEVLEAVKKGKYSMKGNEWENVSTDAKNLIKKMLEYDPELRISANEALQDQWIVNLNEKLVKASDESYSNVLMNIKCFNAKEKFQQATLAYIVHFCYSSNELDDLRKIFYELDKNGDGRLNYGELKAGFNKIFGDQVTDVRFEEIFAEIDSDQNGLIEYQEFLRVGLNKKSLLSEENLRLAFNKMDENQDGKLSIDEIKNVLGTSDNDYVMEILKACDENVRDEISYEEFINFMKKIVSPTKNSPR